MMKALIKPVPTANQAEITRIATGQITAETFGAMQVIFGVGMILQNMDGLKKTKMYSSKVVQTLELYDRTMLKNSIWRESGDAMDEGYAGAQLISRMAYANIWIAENQPQPVQERFERDLKSLFIRYGVNMQEMEKL